MALVLCRVCVCWMVLAACSAPRPGDAPSQPVAAPPHPGVLLSQPSAAPSAPSQTRAAAEMPADREPSPVRAGAEPERQRAEGLQPSAAAWTAITQTTLPDAKPDASGWGAAAGLRYLEIVRGGAAPEEALPMVIVIHGLGDKPSRDWLSAIDLDPSLKARMILPQAPTAYGPGFSWFPYRFRDVNDAGLADGIRNAASGLARAIEQLKGMRPTRGRVIVCGFSQGGMLSFALSLSRPELFQLALPISGMLPQPLWPERQPPGHGYVPRIVALHGTADQTVPFDADAKLVQHLRSLRFPAEIEGYEGVQHQIAPAMSARVRAELSAAVRAKH